MSEKSSPNGSSSLLDREECVEVGEDQRRRNGKDVCVAVDQLINESVDEASPRMHPDVPLLVISRVMPSAALGGTRFVISTASIA